VPLLVVVLGKSPWWSTTKSGLSIWTDAGRPGGRCAFAQLPRPQPAARHRGNRCPATNLAELLPSTATPSHEVTVIDGAKKLTHKISERRWELFDLPTIPTAEEPG